MTQDLRQALRVLAKHPGFLSTALVTLALGIGFSTATFSVVNAVLLRPLPFTNPSQLLILRERHPRFPEFSVSPGHYLTWRAQATHFDGIAAWSVQLVNLDAGSGEPERVRAERVSADLFPVLGVAPLIGRGFAEQDDVEGADPVVLLSYGAWQRRFGGRADVTGRTVRMDQRPVTVIGVMPRGFAFPSEDTEMWVPFAMATAERERYGSHYLSVVARMKPGVTLDRAREDLNAVAGRLAQERPDGNNIGWEVLAFPMHDYSVRDVQRALLVLLGAVALVLLIACMNVANLLLARGAARQRELAVRAAIGASRVRLVRQLLVEQLVLASASAAAGVLLAGWLLRALVALLPDALPRQSDIRLDLQVLAFASLLAMVTPCLFGLLPAVQTSRPELRGLLAVGGRHAGSLPARRLRRALVVAEVALAMVLLVGAGLLIRSFVKLTGESPGFVARQAVVVGVNLPAARYAEGAAREQFFGELLSRTRTLPQVAAAGLTQSVPMVNDYVTGLEIEGRPSADGYRPTTNFYAVDAGYFETLQIPLLRGRLVGHEDRDGAPLVVAVNQTLAERHFPGEDPIGRRIKVSQGRNSDQWKAIVGVVGDVKQYGLAERTSAQVYEPYLQHPYFSGYSIVVRTASDDPASVVPDLRGIVRSLDPDLPLSRTRALEEIVGASIGPQRFSAALIALFGSAALLLAAVGVYGVMAYTVGLRTQEFAIRVVHGASRTDILRLVLSGAASLSVVGVASGLAAAWILRQTLGNLLFGVAADDVPTYAGVAALLTIVALAAGAVPAMRAMRVEPMAVLRGSD
ncbi:MAG TPA: ABC transporter permease [Vicinamibacterales bacterium]|nr:ABC transporter permease [Vicinamibacterales bacterium]